jgi:hypothetical protein
MKKVVVTDHALIRWLQRARGIDMEGLRDALAEIAQPHVDAGVHTVCQDGLWFRYSGEKLVTIVETKPGPVSHFINDRGGRNGAHTHGEKPHWKAAKRKRHHG